MTPDRTQAERFFEPDGHPPRKTAVERIVEEYNLALHYQRKAEERLDIAERDASAAAIRLRENEDQILAIMDENQTPVIAHPYLGTLRLAISVNGTRHIERIDATPLDRLRVPDHLLRPEERPAVIAAEACVDSPGPEPDDIS